MGCNEKIAILHSTCPTKLSSVMEIHRKRFSQLHPKFQQQKRTPITLLQPIQQPFVRPHIPPTAPRPQPRQQTRPKQYQDLQLSHRANTASIKHQKNSSTDSNPSYITLANLTKVLHVLQTNAKISDSEISIETNTSTTTSSKQRVQQHLQETATRWWRPIRSSNGQSSVSVSTRSTRLPESDLHEQQPNSCKPLSSTIVVSNSRQQLDIPSAIVNRNLSTSDESDSSTEIQSITEITKITQPSCISNTKSTRLEPIIMPSRGMRLYTSNHQRYFNTPLHLNFLQHNRLIRPT
ncbi:hypothetical protein I4U23_021505 [Adineta vaga]|nr:hypothetical protein I4U23_021505 [Adineta vaga]